MGRKEFYKTRLWKDVSKSFALSRYCLCERCHRPVYVSGLTDYIPKEQRLKYVVHHKTYLNESNYTSDIAIDENNLELLCIDCHNQEHKSFSTRKGLVFDEMGNLIRR